MKFPGLLGGGKLKKFYREMATTMYFCYLAGRKHEKENLQELSLGEFSKRSKPIHNLGKELYKEQIIHGKFAGTIEKKDS